MHNFMHESVETMKMFVTSATSEISQTYNYTCPLRAVIKILLVIKLCSIQTDLLRNGLSKANG